MLIGVVAAMEHRLQQESELKVQYQRIAAELKQANAELAQKHSNLLEQLQEKQP